MFEGPTSEAMERLGIAVPIIQGPFGGGLSTPQLAATVSQLGGLGSYGAHSLAPEDIAAVASQIRARTAQPFALNLWVSDHDPDGLTLTQESLDRAFAPLAPYFRELGVDKPALPARITHRFDDQVAALIDAAPPAFSFVFGVPAPAILAACKARGIVTIGAATSLAEARALDDAGVDVIVATGAEAGGHRPAFLARAEDCLMGTLALVPQVADRVKAPVIAAGGIADGRAIRAALALGAQAAQLGTAFLACEESNATPHHRELLFSARAEHTVLTRAFTGRLARGLTNRLTRELAGSAPAAFPIQSWLVAQLRPAAIAAGATELLPLWSGQIAPNLRHRTATALMSALIDDLSSEPTHRFDERERNHDT